MIDAAAITSHRLRANLASLRGNLLRVIARDTSSSRAGQFSVSIWRSQRDTAGSVFETKDSRRIPVFPSYRWRQKEGWTFFKPLHLLSELHQKRLLDENDVRFFYDTIGTSTINIPLCELEREVQSRMIKYQRYLVGDVENLQSLFVKPEERKIDETVASFVRRNGEILETAGRHLAGGVEQIQKVVEIGYISGGHSLFAFEELGVKPIGVDNFYSGLMAEASLHDSIARLRDSSVRFVKGDITKRVGLADEYVDLINSSSVLEHILDIEACFRECHRLLRPGGLMVHEYNPYFYPKGGHALGILDSPWAHLRLSEADYERYITTLRPNEAEVALDWYRFGLSRANPASEMQNAIIEAGFELCAWKTRFISEKTAASLSPEIVSDSFKNYPGISLMDLLASHHTFIARKV